MRMCICLCLQHDVSMEIFQLHDNNNNNKFTALCCLFAHICTYICIYICLYILCIYALINCISLAIMYICVACICPLNYCQFVCLSLSHSSTRSAHLSLIQFKLTKHCAKVIGSLAKKN